MTENIMLFPSLNEGLMRQVQFQKSEFSFFFTDRNALEKELKYEPIGVESSIYYIKDETGRWNPDKNDFGLEYKCCLKSVQCLFGFSGIACNTAVLGLAIVWKSSDSKQRGVIPIGTFTYDDKSFDASIKKQFGKAQLRGQLDFTTILYIAEPGSLDSDERHFANTAGYVLGEMDSIKVRLDGNGSTFPIFEVSDPGQPLWDVKCDWLDPTIDAFSDCISINLNTAHKNYKYIDRNRSSFNYQCLSEIMASAVSIIIEKLRLSPYWDQIIGNDALENGSVGQAIYYFSNTLEWDLSSPESVSLSARKFFDQRML